MTGCPPARRLARPTSALPPAATPWEHSPQQQQQTQQQQQHQQTPQHPQQAPPRRRRGDAAVARATFAASPGDDDLLNSSGDFVEATTGWRRRWTVVLLCFVAFTLCNMDRVNMSVAILPMSQQYSWDSQTVGLVQSSFFWCARRAARGKGEAAKRAAAGALRGSWGVRAGGLVLDALAACWGFGSPPRDSWHLVCGAARDTDCAALQALSRCSSEGGLAHVPPPALLLPRPCRGYLLTQVLGGIWADRFGGKLVLGMGVIWWSLATALTPLAAQAGLPTLLAARALMGIGEGVAMPAMNNMLSK